MTSARVLAPTDFSDAALAGLRAARAHAEALGLPVVIVHAWDRAALTLYAPYLKTVQAENVAMMNDVEKELAAKIAQVKADVFDGFDAVSTEILHDASPARAIADFAAPDDVIVLSTHGRTGLRRALLGSVTEKVVRLAPCPVLTVPVSDESE